MTPELTVYLREGCSLCEDMVAELRSLQAELAFGLHTVDVDSDPLLARTYGERVPVLTAPDGELCHYFLDQERVRRYFAAP